jgi:N-acetylmuramoyl-L-alanine amidase
MAFKIAINAGHYMGTSGKRLPKAVDPNQTREWWLNNRVVERVIDGLKAYEGYEILRVDDPTGQKDISLKNRTDAANYFGANIYISVHHNAVGNGSKIYDATGIVVYAYTKVDVFTRQLQKTVYDCLIETTGNKGNRANPLAQASLHEVRETKMPAVLCECGFMDSLVDGKLILTDKYATQLARGLINAIVKVGNLKKKPEPKPVEKPKQETKPVQNTNEIKIGDKVNFKGGKVYSSSTAKTASATKGKATCEVTIIAKGKPHPYHCVGGGVYGWVDAKDIEGANIVIDKPSTPSATTQTFKIGDKVKATDNAVWVSTGKKIPAFIRAKTLYIRSVVSNGTVVVSYLKSGAISGRTYIKDLRKV